MPELRLMGCRSRPLVGYLKALGLLRVVSFQADENVRGRWQNDVFELRSELGEEELVTLLLDGYAPAPVVSPWNGGSGFHANDRKYAVEWLEQAGSERFASYRETIAEARRSLDRCGIQDKPAPAEKLRLLRDLRRTLPDDALSWLDAAVVVTGTDVSYPPLLGSGGNDGRFDFSNNYAQAVVACLAEEPREDSAAALRAALYGDATDRLRKLSLGHLSRDSSPTNSPRGESDSLGNPWDLILAVEGTLLMVAGAARRHGAASGTMLVAPFTARSTAAGYGSAVGAESGRAELWLPLWSGWATRPELSTLVRESRAQIGSGRRGRQARTGLDFARAAGELGVARGIDAFERYAILERAGQSSLAVPAGQVSVAPRQGAIALRSISPWLDRLLRFSSGDRCPRAVGRAIRRLEQAAFGLASNGSEQDACLTLEAIGATEHVLAHSAGSAINAGLRPLFGTPAAPWLEAADDGSPEFAVAASIASLRDRKAEIPALRDYLHGTIDSGAKFDRDRQHALAGNGVAQLLAAIHARRHLDASRSRRNSGRPDRRRLPFDLGSWCALTTARRFAAQTLDDERILRLLNGLALLDHRSSPKRRGDTQAEPSVDPTFDVLALAWMGSAPNEHGEVQHDPLGPRPDWATRLAAGSVAYVVNDALLRLRMAGIPLALTADDLMADQEKHTHRGGQQLAAALLISIDPKDIHEIKTRLGKRDFATRQMEEIR